MDFRPKFLLLIATTGLAFAQSAQPVAKVTLIPKKVEYVEVPGDPSSRLKNIPERYRPLYRGGIAYDKVEAAREAFPYKSITMSRGGCYGSCPVYTVTFRKDGSAHLLAERYLPKIGQFRGEISIFDYGRLCYLIDEMQIQSLKDHYEAPWTDSETVTIMLEYSTGRKVISEYAGVGPIQLWSVEQSIDSIRNQIEWAKSK